MILRIILFITILFQLVACRTDFSINGEYIERPVVHFLLDPNDTYHYLKLNKTFLGDGNAFDFAKVPDSSTFSNVEAIVEEVIGSPGSETISRSWVLKDTFTDNKKEGVFYYPEQKLYYFKADDLNLNAKYRLRIDIEDGTHTVFGETELVDGLSISSPNQGTALNFANNDIASNGYRNESIRFMKGNGAVFNGQLHFYYREAKSGGTETKLVRWNLGDVSASDISTQFGSFTARGERFYEILASRIPEDPDVIRRIIHAVELRVTAGSEDLQTYILVNQPTSSIAQNKKEFSNIEGGLGIFSSRTSVTQYKPAITPPHSRALNKYSTKELCEGQYTFKLNFCSNLEADNSESFACP